MTDLPVILDGPARTKPDRIPGDFHRNHQGAPIVPHPTDTTNERGTKAELIAKCDARGLDHTGCKTNADLIELLGPRPKRVTYGRPSSFGFDDGYQLLRWKERMLVRGLAGVPLGDAADWDDARIDRIVADAYRDAGAHLAADRGTHVHLLTEIVDVGQLPGLDVIEAGETLGIPTVLQERIVEQWLTFRERIGVTALRIEQPIINDELRLAGTADRLDLATRSIDTTLGTIEGAFIGDIKTGSLTTDDNDHPKYWTTYPLQLVAYRDGQPFDPDVGELGERQEWPQTPHPGIALIYHYPLEQALNGEQVDWSAIPVDLTVGRKGAEAVAAVVRWNKRTDRFAPPVQISAGGSPISGTTAPEPPADEPDRRTQLLERYHQLTPADQARFREYGADPKDFDAVETALDAVDPFATVTEPAPVERPTPVEPVKLDEGPPATDDARDAVRTAWGLLEPSQADWVRKIVAQVGNLSIDQNPSQRRVNIGFALVQLAAAGWHDVVLLRACVWHAHVHALDTADAEAARRFADTVQALVNEELQFAVNDDGDMQLIAA